MPTESWDWTGLWFPENDLDDMEVIGNRLFRAAVPVESDAEFKAYIFAAGATHSCGIRSVDNLLRRRTAFAQTSWSIGRHAAPPDILDASWVTRGRDC